MTSHSKAKNKKLEYFNWYQNKQQLGGFKISATPYHQKKALPKAKLTPF